MFCLNLNKVWEYKDGKCELMTSLIGSNASIASIDIDNEVNLKSLFIQYFVSKIKKI
jgi:hypothetical protein